MLVPLSWLRDFAPVEGAPEALARTLSFLGLVVEGIERTGHRLDGIVVARVLSTRPHPSADRIQLVDVDAGDGEALQVCCGAFNMAAGDLVPLATLGTVMPDGMEIARRKMRGEWSNGMLCSARELGLGPEGPEPAILILPQGLAEAGAPVGAALGLAPDVVFNLEISPNRPDCFSMAGVARDLAAALGVPFAIPLPPRAVSSGVELANIKVDESARRLCPRFTGAVIEGVGSVESAPLVKHRLVLAGMRPINPVVDISNYVMLELGQPNHPYDIDRLGGRGLLVRRAREGEIIVTLDGVERRLQPDDCVIADARGAAVGIGGMMGGEAAEISESTTTVLLEMAIFDPGAISATGKRLGLLSEARTRFERGVDPELPELAMDRFVELLGPVVRRGETTDTRAARPERTPLRLRTPRVNLLLGTSLAEAEVERLLRPLGFVAEPAAEGEFEVMVPTWRPDCQREVDLIEEVARLHGYDRIPRTLPARPVGSTGLTPYQRGRRSVREILAGAGSSEAWCPSFTSVAELVATGLDPAFALEVENPLDQSQSMLRPSLLPGLLRAARFNKERQAGALSLFEIGSVFCRPGEADDEIRPLQDVKEWEQLGLLAIGAGADARYAVRLWEVLAGALRLERAGLTRLEHAGRSGRGALAAAAAFHPRRRQVIVLGGEPAGLVGELAKAVGERHGLGGRIAALVVDMAPLLGAPRRSWQAVHASRYPAIDLDLSLVVEDKVAAADVAATLAKAAGELVESMALFDVWRGESLGEGRRSLAFRLRLRAGDRTLTDEEVDRVRRDAARAAVLAHGAVLRAG